MTDDMGDVLRHELDDARRARRDSLLRGPQVCSMAGITYRQLDYWARTGALIPAFEARGSGSQRRYTRGQARAAKVLGLLSEMGAHNAAMAAAARSLEPLGADDWTGVLLVWPDGEAQVVEDPRDVVTSAALYVDLDVVASSFAEVHPAMRAAL